MISTVMFICLQKFDNANKKLPGSLTLLLSMIAEYMHKSIKSLYCAYRPTGDRLSQWNWTHYTRFFHSYEA